MAEQLIVNGYAIEAGANLEGADLSGANLSGMDLNGINLEGANLLHTNLSKANLSGANLKGAYMDYADLRGANIEGAMVFAFSDFLGAELDDDQMSGIEISEKNGDGEIIIQKFTEDRMCELDELCAMQSA